MKFLIFVIMLLSLSLLGSYKEISTKEVKKLIDTKAEYTLVDSLTVIHYSVEHVPTAINIQDKEVKEKIDLLPKDKTKMIIFYCMGPKCFFSKDNAKEAISLGFTNVYVWSKGIPDWKKKGYKTTKGDSFLPLATINFVKPSQLNGNLDKVVVISLFSKEENKGLLPNSKIVHITNFLENYKEIPKDKPILLYSLHGKIDKVAARFLLSKGYSLGNIYYLKGGTTAWKKVGFKLEE